MKLLENTKHINIKQAANGYICQVITAYGSDGEAEIFTDFSEAIIAVAEAFGEQKILENFREARTLTDSLKGFFSAVIKPDLLAIEGKINPGIENVVKDDADDIQF